MAEKRNGEMREGKEIGNMGTLLKSGRFTPRKHETEAKKEGLVT